jgi:hypothetical protein
LTTLNFQVTTELLEQALTIAPILARLKKRARNEGVPSIYVNDNIGQWRLQASQLIHYCVRALMLLAEVC